MPPKTKTHDPKREPLTTARCEKLLSERGLTLTRCEEPHVHGRKMTFYVRNQAGDLVGSATVTPKKDFNESVMSAYKVGWVYTDRAARRERVGTLLYEAMVAEACSKGVQLVSDTYRSEFSEAFWRKQQKKRRARCVKKSYGAGYYDAPRLALDDAYGSGEISEAEYLQITRNLPTPVRDDEDNLLWPCNRYAITQPCKVRRLDGLPRGRRRRR